MILFGLERHATMIHTQREGAYTIGSSSRINIRFDARFWEAVRNNRGNIRIIQTVSEGGG